MQGSVEYEHPTTEVGSIHEEVHQPNVEPHLHFERIICIAVDASTHSEKAFKWAVDNIVNPKTDQVILLNVRPYVTNPIIYTAPMVDSTSQMTPDQYRQVDFLNKTTSHDLIQKYAQHLIQRKIKSRGVALRGDPREEIVYKVNDLKAD
ncbi:hypothetical protein HK099_002488, partial [Clydaea vesicula]